MCDSANCNKTHLPKKELHHGKYYKGQCRNARIARWNANEAKFYHWRTKFSFTFIETIKCPEDDEVFDVFYATEMADTPTNFDDVIPFDDTSYKK